MMIPDNPRLNFPHAGAVLDLAKIGYLENRAVRAEDCHPVYLRDKVAEIPKSS
jgi:tRNA A37 threonylcarbamoyladenosine modification protein TsaB